MYNPEKFRCTDLKKLHDFIERYNFATLVSVHDGRSNVSHLPLLIDRSKGESGTLIGHLAKENPHWKDWDSLTRNGEVTCIFNGPHGYISPSWYVDPLNVPTWNYSVVHAHGSVTLVQESQEIERILAALVGHHESKLEIPWRYELPQDFRANLTRAIVGFEIKITSLEGKFKLSQNRSAEDWRSAVEHVQKIYGESNPGLVSMMVKEYKVSDKK